MTPRKTRSVARSTVLLSALMLSSTALSTAYAQDAAAEPAGEEEITVTAARAGAATSTQKLPMAVTAIGGNDLKTKEIESFKDLQFNVPSVTYSNGNFGSSNFQIRGIGYSAISASADTGVSIHTNDVYLFAGGLQTSKYYDLDRIEILRGPQSTLYGRNATGGVVNVITAKPRLDEYYGHADVTYGEYNTAEANLMLNAPIVENELALRLALNYAHHDGYVENQYLDTDINSQNLSQGRASLRWEPSDSTTIDLIGSWNFQKDSTMRYPKQLCHRDPTGILGCLPDSIGFEPVNGSSTAGTLLASTISPLFGPFGGLLGLYDVPTTPGQYATAPVPRDNLEVATDLDPQYRGQGEFYMGSWRQDINDWLEMNVLVSYARGESSSTSHYNNLVGDDIGPRIDAAMEGMRTVSQLLSGSTAAADLYIDTFFTAPDGSYGLPISIPGSGGVTAGPEEGVTVRNWARRTQAFDEIEGTSQQKSVELRFTSDLDGPVNFQVAGFYIVGESDNSYWVNANSYDYSLIMTGFLNYLTQPGGPSGAPIVFGPTQFRSNTKLNQLKSKAIFGEVYWEAADDLKFTAGLRWTQDEKRVDAQVTLMEGFYRVPFSLEELEGITSPDVDVRRGEFEKVTGRALVEWTPDLSFTDDTLIYASYSRGFKSGGINPPFSTSIPGLPEVPPTYAPEEINAYEMGFKNRFLDNALQANITLWYYDYTGYQISDVVARTAFTQNVDATLYGVEGEFLYRPDDNWQFNLNLTATETELADGISIVDQRNPTGGRSDVVLIKDPASAATCSYIMLPGSGGLSPADAGVGGYTTPVGGSGALAGAGIAHVNFGSCTAGLDPTKYQPTLDPSGIRQDIGGNELPQNPNSTISFGAQYTFEVSEGYEMVVRGDYYWQGKMWGRIQNGPADRIDSWDVVNASIQLNALDQGWYAKLFATNLFDSRELTGIYLTDQSSGLFTNAFVQDPRVIGLTVGVDF